MVYRRNSVVTRILPADISSISFKEDTAPENDDHVCSIETCTPAFASAETLQSLRAASTHMLRNLEPVAFPTETVFGLGALSSSTSAVGRIFQVKGRPSDNPLIVHISSLTMLRHKVLPEEYVMPEIYQRLVLSFWPGPLTLLFPVGELEGKVPKIVTAGHTTVAVRMPAHPVARALIEMAGTPIAAPSANSSGRPSPTKAEHVFKDLSGKIAIILDDGGSSDVGLESTVVDGLHEDGNLRVLRPGGVTVEDLRRVLDEGGLPDVKVLVHRKDYSDDGQESTPTTPGMKYRHYAPTAPVILLIRADTHTVSSISPSSTSSQPSSVAPRHPIEDIPSLLDSLLSRFSLEQNITLGLLFNTDSPFLKPLRAASSSNVRMSAQIHELGTSDTPQITAQRLFDGLLTLDNDGVDVIFVESIEETREGLAVMNRVRKAAGETRWIAL
jgi:L-threonylcarbamoyladenylate synthase